VRYLDRQGNEIEQVVQGLSAGTFQHECDHLQGKLFVDRVKDPSTFSTWKEWERHHKDAFVERVRALVARYGS
jgi:peptide deformylase